MREIDIVNVCHDICGTEVSVFLDILIVRICMDSMLRIIHWKMDVNVVMDIDFTDDVVKVIIQFVRNYMVGTIIIIQSIDIVKLIKSKNSFDFYN